MTRPRQLPAKRLSAWLLSVWLSPAWGFPTRQSETRRLPAFATLCLVICILLTPSPARANCSQFPDRLTGSYSSSQFLAHVGAILQESGWITEVQSYAVVMESYSEEANRTTFVGVQGENLLAFAKNRLSTGSSDHTTSDRPSGPASPIDLLIVAPYDVPAAGSQGYGKEPFTGGSSDVLLEFGKQYSGQNNVAIAFVSGHYQMGAGMRALMGNLSDRGCTVKSVLVLGNLFSDQWLPVIPTASAPVPMVQAVYDHVRDAGLGAFIAGGRSRALWLRAITRGPRQRVVTFENLVDDGAFTGEGDALDQAVPAITLGLPTTNQFKSSPDGSKPQHNANPVETLTDERAKDIVSVLVTLGGENLAGGDSSASPSKGDYPVYGDMTVLQALGRMRMVESKYLAYAGIATGILAAVVIILNSPSLRNRGALGWVSGAVLAALMAQGIRWLIFRSVPAAYIAWVHPERPAMAFLAIFFSLFTAGFLRLWAVRSRIASLPKAAYHSPQSTGFDGGPRSDLRKGAEGRAHNEGFQEERRRASGGFTGRSPGRSSGGAWGLAVMGGVCVGMGLKGSEGLVYSILATVGLLLPVLFEGFFRKKDVAIPRHVTWLNRVWYLTPLIPGLVWAASSCWFDGSAENIASTLCVGVAVGCLLSTFGMPKPVSRRRLGLLNLGSLLAPLMIVAVAFTVANSTVLLYPVSISESYGFGSVVTISATRPLGEVALARSEDTEDAPLGTLTEAKDGSGRLELRLAEKIRCQWAVMRGKANRESATKLGSTGRFDVGATLQRRPTFFCVEARDVPVLRGESKPFTLNDIDSLLDSMLEGISGEDSVAYLGNKPRLNPQRGYRVRLIWWYPPGKEIDASLVTTTYGSGRVEVTTYATYLSESYLGIELAKPEVEYTRSVIVSISPLWQ